MKPLPLLLIATFLTAFSCQQNDGKHSTDHLDRGLSDTTSVTGLSGDSAKLVKTASVHFKVKEVEKSTIAISGVVRKYRGAVHYQNFRSPQTGRKELKVSDDSLLVITTASPQADMTIRIPSNALESFLFEVIDMGYHTDDITLRIDDKSLYFLENELKRKNRIAAVTGRQQNADSNVTWRTLQVKDEAVAQFITNKAIDADVAYSTIQLVLFQNAVVQKEMIANYDIADYQLSLSTRIGHAFYKGWEVFLNLWVALLHLWPFAMLGIGLYAGWRFYQRRKIVV